MKTGKERQKKYRLKKASEGKQSVTVFLSTKAYNFLEEKKDDISTNYSDVIDKALIFYKDSIIETKRNGLVILDKQDTQPKKKRLAWFGRKEKK